MKILMKVTNERGGALFLKKKKEEHTLYIFCKDIVHTYLSKKYIIRIQKYIPFEEESERSQEDGSERLTIENEDESVHSTIEDSFRDQKHDCIYDLYHSHHHVWFLRLHVHRSID